MQIMFNPADPADWAHVLALGTSMGVTAISTGADDDDDGPADSTAPVVDAFGTPWLADFHAPKRTRNADGSWRRKKGVDKQAAEAAEVAARVPVGTPAAAHDTPAAAHDTPPPGGYLPPAGTGIAQVQPAGIPSPLTPAAPALPILTAVAPVVPVESVWAKLNDIQTKFPGQLTAAVWTDMLIKSFGVANNEIIETDETGRGKLIAEIHHRFGV